MRQAWGGRLIDEILLLHPSIIKVFILEERTDRFMVVEERARAGVGHFVNDIDRSLASGTLNPALLDNSVDLSLGPPRLVGVLYSKEGVLFSRISAQTVVAISTEPSDFDEVLQIVSRALPTLIGQSRSRSLPEANPISAAEATETARNYVAAVVKSPDISIDEATLHRDSQTWNIQGSFRSMPFARSRRFQLQLGSGNGAVVRFIVLQTTSIAPLLTGIGVIVGTLFFLIWVLSLIR